MSQKAWNLCFRHLNLKHKLRRRIRPQTAAPTNWSESTSPRAQRAARRRAAGPDCLFPETVQGIRDSLGDPEIRGLTSESKWR
jgi:hypothetical protein